MKKRYLILGLMAKSFFSFGQGSPQEPVYKKQKLKETEVQALFSYYTQDGNHSAITGGTGTEKLSVYAPEISISHKPDSLNTISFNAGVDVITSASTDKIDFVVSSASRVDARSHINLSYSRKLANTGITAGINTGLSVESDYTSLPIGLHFSKINADASREIQVGLQCYFDDLRWGRLNPHTGHKPVKLIYPEELRYKEWYDTYRRTSFNLNTAIYQVVNKRMEVGIMPELVYQKGLLSTPFHRVYFKGEVMPKVENLPEQRWKVPVGLQANLFVAKNIILRTYYRFYWDNIGIVSHTFQLEAPIKLTPNLSIAPHFRFYTQTASRYFKPYKEHTTDEIYYTSDYDLSAFNSYKAGLTLRFVPQAEMFRNYFFNEASLRYAYYKRTDGLHAHMLTLLLDLKRSKVKEMK